MRTLLTAMLALLLVPAAAHAGGWASAGVLNPPQDVAAGEIWNARIEILQHGRTPMTDLQPAVIVGRRRYEAAPVAGRPGVYAAEVVFPRAGEIHYRVDDGFTNVDPHTFVATIGDRSAVPAASGGFPWPAVAGGTAAAVVAALLMLTLRRRRSALPA